MLSFSWSFSNIVAIAFPALKEAGIARKAGPIGVMLEEHEQGRVLVKKMHNAVEKEETDKKAFVNAASSYIELLRNHINKENYYFIPYGRCPFDEVKTNRPAKGF